MLEFLAYLCSPRTAALSGPEQAAFWEACLPPALSDIFFSRQVLGRIFAAAGCPTLLLYTVWLSRLLVWY